MKYILLIISSLTIPAMGFTENTQNPRMLKLDPYAWQGLPMKVIISDFQQSDGVFTSFICGEIINRLSKNTLQTLKELNDIDEPSRTDVFKICMHPESGEGFVVLKPISQYKKQFPEVVNEIVFATEPK